MSNTRKAMARGARKPRFPGDSLPPEAAGVEDRTDGRH